jgi:hypothetical protein
MRVCNALRRAGKRERKSRDELLKTSLDKPPKFPLNLYKMFLLFPETLLERVLSIVEIGKRRLFVDIPPGRFGSSRPSLREGIVLE